MCYIYSPESDDVRTEGNSYGMMINVQYNKQGVFDAIWKVSVQEAT